MKIKKKLLFTGAILAAALLSACAKKAEFVIHDGSMDTKIEAEVPKSVEDIVKEAEIKLNDGDETTPARTSEMQDATEITIRRMISVTVDQDGEKKKVDILSGSLVKDVLSKEKISLTASQSLNVKDEDEVKDGMEIVITTTYGIAVVHDGKTEEVESGVGSVGDVLKKLNITLGEEDTVTPELTKEVSEGTRIVVSRVTYEEEKETEEIPFTTIREDDSSLKKGTEKVKTEGVAGEKTITYKVKKVDGVEESRELLGEKVTKEPENEVVLVGTKEGRYEVSRVAVPNCADGSHGYYEITYSDGTKEYVEY